MTAVPREVAQRRPANASAQVSRDDGRTIDGQWKAKRGGWNGRTVFTAFLTFLLAALMAGFLLSLLQQS